MSTKFSKLLRLCIVLKSSTWGNIALIPIDLGSNSLYRKSGFNQINRRHDLWSLRISSLSPSPSLRSKPSEIKITMVIDEVLVDKAVQVLHEEFELEK